MKTLSRFLFAAVIAVLVAGCEYELAENNAGFPRKLTMPKEGGTIVLTGDWHFEDIQIHMYDGNTQTCYIPDNDSLLRIQYDWLTAEAEYRGNELRLTAEPSYSAKNRKLYVASWDSPTYIEIIVKQ